MSGGPNSGNGSEPARYRRQLWPVVWCRSRSGDDFIDTGLSRSRKVKPEDRERFYAAIRSQGPELVDIPEGGSKREGA